VKHFEMKNIQKHFWHYLVYLLVFGTGLTLVVFAKGNAQLQAMFLMMTMFVYFLWAMVHHYVHHQLHPRIVVEYILIVSLGSLLLLFLFGI
jgi:hypothetical protein